MSPPPSTGPPPWMPADLARGLSRLSSVPGLLVGVDFDGTLAPLVHDRERARPLPAATRALNVLASRPDTTVALVSGRTLSDLRRLADPPARAVLVGSHGAELQLPGPAGSGPDQGGPLDAAAADLLARIGVRVEAIAGAHPGAEVERKPTAVVLHTRGCSADVGSRAALAALAGPGSWDGVYVTPGKQVVELAVTDVSKGAALRRLATVLGLPTGRTVYLGDDTTDERAFEALDVAAGDVTVKVGDGDTGAAHRVAGPAQVAELLTWLAALRDPGCT